MKPVIERLSPELEHTLKSLGHFVYFPNPGNLGDELIAVATVQQFERLGLSFEWYDESKNYAEGFTLVYGGGGGMIPDWGYLTTIERAFSAPGLARCVVLPHSMRDCNELLEKLDERFTIFCREKTSWEYCRNTCSKATVYLADDMGCSLIPDAIPSQNELHEALPKRLLGLIPGGPQPPKMSCTRHYQNQTYARY